MNIEKGWCWLFMISQVDAINVNLFSNTEQFMWNIKSFHSLSLLTSHKSDKKEKSLHLSWSLDDKWIIWFIRNASKMQINSTLRRHIALQQHLSLQTPVHFWFILFCFRVKSRLWFYDEMCWNTHNTHRNIDSCKKLQLNWQPFTSQSSIVTWTMRILEKTYQSCNICSWKVF